MSIQFFKIIIEYQPFNKLILVAFSILFGRYIANGIEFGIRDSVPSYPGTRRSSTVFAQIFRGSQLAGKIGGVVVGALDIGKAVPHPALVLGVGLGYYAKLVVG